jgi:hypothetical protein
MRPFQAELVYLWSGTYHASFPQRAISKGKTLEKIRLMMDHVKIFLRGSQVVTPAPAIAMAATNC